MKKEFISFGATALALGIVCGTNVISVEATNDVEVNNSEVSDDSNIATGSDGETSYTLTKDGTLHIYAGTVGADGVPYAFGMDESLKPLVTKISFDGKVVALADSGKFFTSFPNLVEINNLENFDTSNVIDMSGMFSGLTKLKTVDLSKLNVNNVTNMQDMFKNTGLESMDLTNWNVNKVKSISGMFDGSKVNSLDISTWNVASLTSTAGLFANVPNLTSLKMFKDFKNITSTSRMFMGSQITSLDASDWNMSNVNNASMMFANANIQVINASNWDLSNASLLESMFAMMPSLTSIDVSNWKLPETTINMSQMFFMDSSLKKLDLSTWSNKDSSFFASLAATGISQLKVASSTELTDSLMGVKLNEDGSPVLDEEGNPSYEGYLIKVNQVDTDLISSEDFSSGNYSGTYNYVVPSTTISAIGTIESNKGVQTFNMDVSGDLTKEVEITVPAGPNGSTPDKETVKGKVVATTDEDGNTTYAIKVIDPQGEGYVTYSGGNSGSGSTNSNSHSNITSINHLLATHPNNGSVSLYKSNTDNITNRALAQDSSWFSDQEMIKNGVKYYRVATNEWVKSSDVYVYEDQDLVIETNAIQNLITSKAKSVTNRALANATSWKVDRLAQIDGFAYYRVATNEFVLTDEVTAK